MVTKSHTTRKKAPAKKKTTTKKAAPARSSAATRVHTKRAEVMRSFRVYRPDEPFFTLRVNRQTFYWLIIMLAVAASALWIIRLQTNVNELYDQIQQLNVNTR